MPISTERRLQPAAKAASILTCPSWNASMNCPEKRQHSTKACTAGWSPQTRRSYTGWCALVIYTMPAGHVVLPVTQASNCLLHRDWRACCGFWKRTACCLSSSAYRLGQPASLHFADRAQVEQILQPEQTSPVTAPHIPDIGQVMPQQFLLPCRVRVFVRHRCICWHPTPSG